MATVLRRPRIGSVLLACSAILLAHADPGQAKAGEAYYLLLFGSQRIPNEPNYAHSFATFVRVSWPGDGPCPPAPCLEAHTISWLPRTLVVHTLRMHPECGHNFDLHTTLRDALANGERVSLWGPYQIQPELYARALRRIARLESGCILYQANDGFHRDDKVTNCMHAISAISEGPRLVVLSPGWGEMGSYAILKELTPWIIDPCRTHPWLAYALGLQEFPIIYRDGMNPRSGGILGPLYRLRGGERNLQATYGPPQ